MFICPFHLNKYLFLWTWEFFTYDFIDNTFSVFDLVIFSLCIIICRFVLLYIPKFLSCFISEFLLFKFNIFLDLAVHISYLVFEEWYAAFHMTQSASDYFLLSSLTSWAFHFEFLLLLFSFEIFYLLIKFYFNILNCSYHFIWLFVFSQSTFRQLFISYLSFLDAFIIAVLKSLSCVLAKLLYSQIYTLGMLISEEDMLSWLSMLFIFCHWA